MLKVYRISVHSILVAMKTRLDM